MNQYLSKTSRVHSAPPVHVVIHGKRRSGLCTRRAIQKYTRPALQIVRLLYLRRENTAVMSTQSDAGIPLSLLAEDHQQSFRLLELPAELLKLLTSDNPPT